ncbi:MAG: carbonic anhydrase [bacterium]
MSDKISLVLMCIDYRFWPEALPLLEKKYGEFDLIELAGASKNLVSPTEEADRTALLENIGISISLHHPHQIILTNHTDCGMYGGSKNFKSLEEEINFQINDLKSAKDVIKQKFPELPTVMVLIHRDQDEKISIEEVV